MCIVVGYEYLNSGQARACKHGLIRFWFGMCKRLGLSHTASPLHKYNLQRSIILITSGELRIDGVIDIHVP